MDSFNNNLSICTFAKPANWVTLVPNPTATIEHNAPFSFAIVDYQDYIDTTEIHSYRDTYECINDPSRLEDASLITYELHQDTQSIVIHKITIFRDGLQIDALDKDNISILQRERSLENHITDNRLTVSLSIDDLRVGDHLRVSTTNIEKQTSHPLHGKCYSGTYRLEWKCPVDYQRIRVINHCKDTLVAKIHTSKPESKITTTQEIPTNDEFERVDKNLAIESIPTFTPNWILIDFVEIATKDTWKNISKNLYSFYEENNAFEHISIDSIDELGILADAITLKEKAIKVIRFVQNNIRYRGENQGIYTHTPKPPSKVLKKRAGDCKDKSNLLLAMLRTLEIDAELILVHSQNGQRISTLNPSAYRFDHMIIGVTINTKVYYFDATIQKQAGNIEHSSELDYGYGLPVMQDGSELVLIKRKLTNETFHLKHYFNLPSDGSERTLSIERQYKYHRADNMRNYFSSNENTQIENYFFETGKTETGLSLRVINPVTITQDDTDLNILTIIEKYEILELETTHKDKQIQVFTEFHHDLPLPTSFEYPVRIDLDGKITHTILIDYQQPPKQQNAKYEIKSHYFEYYDTFEITPENKLKIQSYIAPKAEYVLAGEDAKDHAVQIEKLRQRSSNNINPARSVLKSKADLAQEESDNKLVYWVLGIAIYCLYLILKY